MATCTCDCCNPDTPTTLNYTTKEINQILADGVINASVRYAPVGQNYLQLTLADALALVPDKERTTVRILTFLNKDTQPKPEVWIYFGTDILTWSDATKWVELPIPDPGKLSKYLTSDIVDGIQVVENAPGGWVLVMVNQTDKGKKTQICGGFDSNGNYKGLYTRYLPDNVNWSQWKPISGGGSRGESPTYIFPGDPSKLSEIDSLTTITSILGTASDFLDAFNNGKVFVSKTVTFSGVSVPSDITYNVLKSGNPDTPTIFQIIMCTIIWSHYIEVTIDFENSKYQAITGTINGCISVNTTGTSN